MTAFDVTLTCAPPDLAVPESDGGPSLLELHCTVLAGFPAQQGLVGIPMGKVRIPIEREAAINLGKLMVAEAERLPKTSKLEVATDLAGVEQAADQINRFKP